MTKNQEPFIFRSGPNKCFYYVGRWFPALGPRYAWWSKEPLCQWVAGPFNTEQEAKQSLQSLISSN